MKFSKSWPFNTYVVLTMRLPQVAGHIAETNKKMKINMR